jgi:hypothetical protein
MFRRTLFGVIAGLAFLAGIDFAFAQGYPLRDFSPGWHGPRMGWNRGPRPNVILPPVADPDRGPGVDSGQLLPPRAIIGSLFRRGYSDVEIKRVRGDSYIATASGPQGGRVLIVVDGHTTEITGLRQMDWDRPPRRWDNDDWSPPRPWSGPRW